MNLLKWNLAGKLFNRCFFLLWVLAWLFIFPHYVFGEEWVRVKWVADGDTIVLKDGTFVRYIAIDSPEIDHQNNIAEPYGYAAKEYNEKLVLSTKLRLEYDREKTDRFGRKLAYVFTENGVFVNQALLEKGYAFYLHSKPNLKYRDLLIKTQQQAMAHKRGIWKNLREKSEWYIGNRNSKRFHTPDCSWGKKTHPKNEILLTSAWDAFWQGYAPCRRCLSLGDLNDP